MATYTDLFTAASDSVLQQRVSVALTVSASAILEDPLSTLEGRNWSQGVLYEPAREAKKALRYILAKNQGATVAQIQNSTDVQIQTQVDAIVDALVAALNNL